jgi:hypothetical protein
LALPAFCKTGFVATGEKIRKHDGKNTILQLAT